MSDIQDISTAATPSANDPRPLWLMQCEFGVVDPAEGAAVLRAAADAIEAAIAAEEAGYIARIRNDDGLQIGRVQFAAPQVG